MIDLDELMDLAEVRDNKQRMLELSMRKQYLILRMSQIILRSILDQRVVIPEEIFNE